MNLLERIDNYLINEKAAPGGNIEKYLKPLYNKSPREVERTLKSSWEKLADALEANDLEKDAIAIINKHLKTNYRSLSQISKGDIKKLPVRGVYEELMNEDFAHFWELVKTEAFPALSFYPMLTCWLELDKLLSGTGDFNATKTGIYALFWAVLVSGKFLKGWEKWRKENPKEFEKEGAKKNPFAIKKDYGDFRFE